MVEPDEDPDYEAAEDAYWEAQEVLQRQACVQIGEFLYSFSVLESAIRDAFVRCIKLDFGMSDAVVGWWDFANLCTTFRAVLQLRSDLSKEEAEITLQALSDALKLNTDVRVPVAHGTWAMGGEAGLFTSHLSRGSRRRVDYFKLKDALVKHTENARQLTAQFVFFDE